MSRELATARGCSFRPLSRQRLFAAAQPALVAREQSTKGRPAEAAAVAVLDATAAEFLAAAVEPGEGLRAKSSPESKAKGSPRSGSPESKAKG